MLVAKRPAEESKACYAMRAEDNKTLAAEEATRAASASHEKLK